MNAAPEIAVSDVKIAAINVRSVVVPLARLVITANATIAEAPLVLVDVTTNAGVTGRAYTFAYSRAFLPALNELVAALSKTLIGETLAPLNIERNLRTKFTLLGGAYNLAAFAISVLDMAVWDAFARSAKMPLATLLGAVPKPIKAYSGNGVGMVAHDSLSASIDAVMKDTLPAIKVRLGRQCAADDIGAVERVKRWLSSSQRAETTVMVDFNQSLNVAEAVVRCAALDAFDLAWIEEPTRCDDWAGNAAIAKSTRTPIQLGENIASDYALVAALDACATDYVMFDAQQIGGVSGWLRASSVASARGVPVSSHLLQEFSAHLLSVTPNAAWLEYFPMADPILAQCARVENGCVATLPGDGAGIEWNEHAISRYAA